MSDFTYAERVKANADTWVYSVFVDGDHVGFVKRFIASWPKKVEGARYTFGTTYGVRWQAFTPSGEQVGHRFDTRGLAAAALLDETP